MKKITNMKRAVTAVLLAVFAALSFASCVKDEEPIFKESASVRLQNALKNAQDVLVGAENACTTIPIRRSPMAAMSIP